MKNHQMIVPFAIASLLIVSCSKSSDSSGKSTAFTVDANSQTAVLSGDLPEASEEALLVQELKISASPSKYPELADKVLSFSCAGRENCIQLLAEMIQIPKGSANYAAKIPLDKLPESVRNFLSPPKDATKGHEFTDSCIGCGGIGGDDMGDDLKILLSYKSDVASTALAEAAIKTIETKASLKTSEASK